MTTNQEKQELWQRHTKACEDSGLSMVAYCKGAGINQHTLQYWRTKFRNEAKKKTVVVAANFIRVIAQGPRAPAPVPGTVARLRLGQDVVFECLAWPDTKWLGEFVRGGGG